VAAKKAVAVVGREQTAALTALGERHLGGLRLRVPSQLRQLERSLARYGQLDAVVAYPATDALELIDGFKRLHVARELGWSELRVRIAEVDATQAKLLVLELHGQCGLSAIEEGWLVRALYRHDGLSQGRIAERLGRHKSWVCRRLLLVEQLDDVGFVRAVEHRGRDGNAFAKVLDELEELLVGQRLQRRLVDVLAVDLGEPPAQRPGAAAVGPDLVEQVADLPAERVRGPAEVVIPLSCSTPSPSANAPRRTHPATRLALLWTCRVSGFVKWRRCSPREMLQRVKRGSGRNMKEARTEAAKNLCDMLQIH